MELFTTILKAVGAIFGPLVALFRERQQYKAGQVAQTAAVQKETVHEVQVAQEARAAVEHELAVDPASLRVDDGFKRPD